jgi:tryptophan synthase alpha subunit
MTHIVAGYPTLNESKKIALLMANECVKFIEIQIPFSDPIADGKTILKANTESLKNGTTPADCFKLMKEIHQKTTTPLLFMTYFNIAYSYGLEKFCKEAKKAGCYGLIIPDIPIDEENHENYLKLCNKYNLNPIQVISPITPEKRLKKLNKAAKGFVYCVSTTGTTGERKALQKNLKTYLQKVKKHIKLPIALGFGISTPHQVKEAKKHADIIVIGSKIINIYNKSRKISDIKKFIQSILK